MTSRFHIQLQKDFDPGLLRRVEDVFHGENLIQTILHAHLLIERAVTLRIAERLARPEILEDGRYGRWSFHQKLALYVGLCSPPADQERMLFGFNRLRNMIAHRLDDAASCVAECLRWEGEQAPMADALGHVWVVAGILLFELGALRSVRVGRKPRRGVPPNE